MNKGLAHLLIILSLSLLLLFKGNSSYIPLYLIKHGLYNEE